MEKRNLSVRGYLLYNAGISLSAWGDKTMYEFLSSLRPRDRLIPWPHLSANSLFVVAINKLRTLFQLLLKPWYAFMLHDALGLTTDSAPTYHENLEMGSSFLRTRASTLLSLIFSTTIILAVNHPSLRSYFVTSTFCQRLSACKSLFSQWCWPSNIIMWIKHEWVVIMYTYIFFQYSIS